MIRYLKLPYLVINLTGILPAVMQIFMVRVWGTLSDKYGHKFVMNASTWFFAGEIFIWAVTPKSAFLVLIPFACIFSAVANSGFTIGAFNRRYTLIPEKGRIIYDGFYSSAVGISLIIAPLLGGLAKNTIASNEFIMSRIEFGEFRILYLISCIGIIVLQVFNTVRNGKPAGKSISSGL
jgi:MFS family permease